jgi:hypothetical protein
MKRLLVLAVCLFDGLVRFVQDVDAGRFRWLPLEAIPILY